MKNIVFCVIFIVIGGYSFAQETGNDSYTIQRLIVFNENGEILLQKHANGWMTPALRHNTATTIDEGLFKLASGFGLEISKPQLRGIFMYFHSDGKKPSFRQHFSSTLIHGELKIPEGLLDAQWFLPNVAIQKMLDPDAKTISAIGEMTSHILNFPKIIWGGSYSLVIQEGEKAKSEVLEHFYPIGKIE